MLAALMASMVVLLAACGSAGEAQEMSGLEQESARSNTSETAAEPEKPAGLNAAGEGSDAAYSEQVSSENAAADPGDKGQNPGIASVEISFDYTRMSTPASNQIAVWVEDAGGNVVRTVYVSDFTGRRRGYTKREDALPHWVAAADPAQMSDEEIDAVSGATPQEGAQSFVWDLKDDNGETIPSGIYTVRLEATLYWSSNVLYSGTIDTGSGQPGENEVTEDRSEPGTPDNETMIANVKMTGKEN